MKPFGPFPCSFWLISQRRTGMSALGPNLNTICCIEVGIYVNHPLPSRIPLWPCVLLGGFPMALCFLRAGTQGNLPDNLPTVCFAASSSSERRRPKSRWSCPVSRSYSAGTPPPLPRTCTSIRFAESIESEWELLEAPNQLHHVWWFGVVVWRCSGVVSPFYAIT